MLRGAAQWAARELLALFELERRRIHAITQSGRRGAVFEHVAQMRITAATQHFRAAHEKTVVLMFRDNIRCKRLPIARPTGAGIEFSVGTKQRIAAANTGVRSGRFAVVIVTTEGGLGAVFTRNFILNWRQLRRPFCVGFDDFVGHEEYRIGTRGRDFGGKFKRDAWSQRNRCCSWSI